VTISKSHLSPCALDKEVDVNRSVVDVRLDVIVVRLVRSGEQHSAVPERLEMELCVTCDSRLLMIKFFKALRWKSKQRRL